MAGAPGEDEQVPHHVPVAEARVLREEFAEDLGKTKGLSEEEVEAMLRRTREDADTAVRALRAADIAVDPKSCDHCDYSPVCRFEKWKLIYKEVS